jgi:hypothetical protein
MKVVRKGRLKVSKGVPGGVQAQLSRNKWMLRGPCFIAANRVRNEAARIARNQIGANDRVVRGYKVQESPDGYFEVLNDSRGSNGRALGQPWEQGTGIYYRKYETSGRGAKQAIKASRYGKPYFVWLQRANEQKRGVAFFGSATPEGYGETVSIGEGRVRRDTKGRIRKRRTNPGQWIFAKEIDGFPGTHALEKASRNMAKVHKWKYNKNRTGI